MVNPEIIPQLKIQLQLSLYRRPKIFEPFSSLVAAESTRNGGFSQEPYASLNLGLYTDDQPEIVAKNRALFFESLGFKESQVAGSYQIHRDKILIAKEAGQFKGYDALISRQKGLLLTVTIADCTPVLVYDLQEEVIAAIHAGWRSTVLRIVEKTIHTMRENFGTQTQNCFAYIGSCISEKAFEVDADVADHFSKNFRRRDESRKKFFIDLKAANNAQLIEADIPQSHIEISPFCTVFNNESYFSYRKESGKTGRMLGAIGII